MKILHIIDSDGLFGAEIVLLHLVAEQKKMGLDPTIASIGEKRILEKPLEKEGLRRGLKIEKFRMRRGPNYLGALRILRFAHQNGFDLMHSHGYKGNILLGFLPRQISKIPLVTTLHGWTSSASFTRMRLYEWLDSLSLGFMDAVVVVNKAMLSDPKLRNRKGLNLYVVNNGIPVPRSMWPCSFSKYESSRLLELDERIIHFCRGAYTIGSIGRLAPEKGFSNLIEATDIAWRRGMDLRLVVIGEGPERAALERMIRERSLQNRVLLPGYRYEAREYLGCFDIFALSSYTEGLPITILEAMRAGVPILSTRVGGVPDVLDDGKTAVLVEPSNTHELADGICRLHGNPDLSRTLSENARELLIRNYSSVRMATEYMNVYRRLF